MEATDIINDGGVEQLAQEAVGESKEDSMEDNVYLQNPDLTKMEELDAEDESVLSTMSDPAAVDEMLEDGFDLTPEEQEEFLDEAACASGKKALNEEGEEVEVDALTEEEASDPETMRIERDAEALAADASALGEELSGDIDEEELSDPIEGEGSSEGTSGGTSEGTSEGTESGEGGAEGSTDPDPETELDDDENE